MRTLGAVILVAGLLLCVAEDDVEPLSVIPMVVGLIILARDYAARLGAKIVSVNGGSLDPSFTVTVRASIAADEVEQR